MKKILIAFAAVALALTTKAAVVSWNVSGTVAEDGCTVLLLLSEPSSSYDSVDALKAAAVGQATISKVGRVYTTGDQQASGADVTASSSFYYAIIANGAADSFSYVEATGMGAAVFEPPASGTTFSSISAANILSGTSGKIGGNVPEPTTGLLVLLGMAGLALKRKLA